LTLFDNNVKVLSILIFNAKDKILEEEMRKRKNTGLILQILNILKEETDSQHLITQNGILKKLREKGYNCRRYTIEKNLDCLREMGYDIQTTKGVGTFLKVEGINPSDVFVLNEALNKANFIIEKEYIDSIKEKLLNLLNKFEQEELKNINLIL